MSKVSKGTLFTIVIVLLLVTFVVTIAVKRKLQLENDFSVGKARITEVKFNVSKGTTQTQNIAKFSYVFKDEKYKKTVEIYNKRIKKGECYEIKISNENPNNSKINLDKKIACNE